MGYVSALWIAKGERSGLLTRIATTENVLLDPQRGGGRRFIVHADEKLTAFLELERAVCIRLLTERI